MSNAFEESMSSNKDVYFLSRLLVIVYCASISVCSQEGVSKAVNRLCHLLRARHTTFARHRVSIKVRIRIRVRVRVRGGVRVRVRVSAEKVRKSWQNRYSRIKRRILLFC